MPLTALAQHLEADVVVTSNDHHMMISRAGLPAIAALRNLTRAKCEAQFAELCTGRSPVFEAQFTNYNAYCVQVAHLAQSGLRHIETSHPGCSAGELPLHVRVLNTHPLLRPLSYRTGANQHLVRWALPPPARQPRGTRIVCGASPADGVQCHFCGPGRSFACPTGPVDLVLNWTGLHAGSDEARASNSNSGGEEPSRADLRLRAALLSNLTLDRPHRRGISYLMMRAPNGTILGPEEENHRTYNKGRTQHQQREH